MVVIHKYIVKMYDANNVFKKSMKTRASSELRAISNLIFDEFWYDEGTGVNCSPLKYPLTFKAEIDD